MALDWPAFGDALWRVSDQTGIRPEWQLPVIALETVGTFNPAIKSPGGCVGLNQFCPSAYSSYVHVPVDAYRQWSASRQLGGPILDYWNDAIRGYGPIRSATKLMVAQLSHSALKTASTPDSVIFSSPSSEYTANSRTFDTTGKGYIAVRDIAKALAYRARTPAVKDAIARAYAMRPGEPLYDPVYGLDYGTGAPIEIISPPTVARSSALGITAAVLGLAAAAGVATHHIRSLRLS